MATNVTHLTGGDLYDFFSSKPGDQLTAQDRQRIAVHIASCSECASIGKDIEEDELALDALVAAPQTTEDQAAVERSLAGFRSRTKLVNLV